MKGAFLFVPLKIMGYVIWFKVKRSSWSIKCVLRCAIRRWAITLRIHNILTCVTVKDKYYNDLRWNGISRDL